MKTNPRPRREFLVQAGGAAAATFVGTQWPAVLAAAQHAHDATKSGSPAKFEVLTPEQARNVEAIASQIIPSDELPGAREAGVVFFIDRALKTFAKEAVPVYQKGLADLNQLTSEKHPGTKSFADATPAQQEGLIADLVEAQKASANPPRRRRVSTDFFGTIWEHTVLGFLADPEAGGNRNYAGWKVIGRDPAHTFSPPFGYYDKDYPGWQPASSETEKK